jgi:hypothetical protein
MVERKTRTKKGSAGAVAQPPVFYHGLRILPLMGKRSPVAEALRQSLAEQALANREAIDT